MSRRPSYVHLPPRPAGPVCPVLCASPGALLHLPAAPGRAAAHPAGRSGCSTPCLTQAASVISTPISLPFSPPFPYSALTPGHSSTVTAVGGGQRGTVAVSGGGDGTLTLWDLELGRAVRTLEGEGGVVGDALTLGLGDKMVAVRMGQTLQVRGFHTAVSCLIFGLRSNDSVVCVWFR